jgi:hypothetical protein
MKKIAMLFLCTVCFIGAAWAQTGGEVLSVEELDRDMDGYICWPEFQRAFPGVEREIFDQFDIDDTGALDQEQWENARIYLQLRGYQIQREPSQEQPMKRGQ